MEHEQGKRNNKPGRISIVLEEYRRQHNISINQISKNANGQISN